jgi:hypothetical protein
MSGLPLLTQRNIQQGNAPFHGLCSFSFGKRIGVVNVKRKLVCDSLEPKLHFHFFNLFVADSGIFKVIN